METLIGNSGRPLKQKRVLLIVDEVYAKRQSRVYSRDLDLRLALSMSILPTYLVSRQQYAIGHCDSRS
jgi:hypothetical protein